MGMQGGKGGGRGGGGGQGRGQGGGMGKGGGRGIGPGGNCVCPKCAASIPHERGIPCYDVKCPQCGTAMIRG